MISSLVISHPPASLRIPFLASCTLHLLAMVLFLHVVKFPIPKPPTKIIWVEAPKIIPQEIPIPMKEVPREVLKSLPSPKVKTVTKTLSAPPEIPKPRPQFKPLLPSPKLKSSRPLKNAETLAALLPSRSPPSEPAPIAAPKEVEPEQEYVPQEAPPEPSMVSRSDPEYIQYQMRVRLRILREWVLPPATLEGGMPRKAKIVVRINAQGQIISREWESSSDHSAFDTSCERAIARSSPLPIPPDRLKWEASKEGLLVEFDSSLKGRAL